MRLTVSLILALAIGLSPNAAEALRLRILTPEELLQRSEVVFVGTLINKVPSRHGGSIFTTYQFSRLRFIKGTFMDTVTIMLEGGRIGDEMIVVDEQPSFEVGGRYIVFADLHYASRQVVLESFDIRRDKDGQLGVFSSNGAEATTVSPRRFTFVRAGEKRPDPPIPRKTGGAAMSDSEIAEWRRDWIELQRREEDQAIQLWAYDEGQPRMTDEEFVKALEALLPDSVKTR